MDCLTAEQIVAHLGRRLPRADEDAVVEHLDTCPPCREFVSAALGADLGPGETSTAPQGHSLEEPNPRRLLPGTPVGRFLVLERLGAGAMGSVYSAYDPKLERKVALKLLHAGKDSEQHLRLLDEARALARLSHPNVTAIHEVGDHTDGRTFMSMQLVAGQTLAGWLGEKPRSHREVLQVMRQAADGLSAAHRAGLVHRDFKPSNVMVSAEGRVYVTDFGLVNADGQAGTPAYMAPEQLAGQKADARSDQFSFAATLYEALVGVRPFVAPSWVELEQAIRARRYAPAPEVALPRTLRSLLDRGLAADPKDRFESMEALRDALERPTTPRVWALVGVLALTTILGGSVAVLRWQRAGPCEQPVPEVSSSWDEARRALIRAARPAGVDTDVEGRLDLYAERLTHAFQANCASHQRREDADGVFQKRRACLLRAAATLSATVGGFQQPTGWDRSAIESLLSSLPDPQRCKSGDVIFEPELPADGALASSVNDARVELARLETAFIVYQWPEKFSELAALQVRARALHYPPLSAQVDRTMGKWQYTAGHYAEAHQSLLDAAAAALSIGQDEVAVECLNVLASLDSLRLDRAAEAEAFMQLSLALSERPRVSAWLRTQTQLRKGMMLVNLGRHAEARETLLRVLDDQRPISGGSSGVLTTLGAAERGLGMLEASREHLELSASLVDQHFSGNLRPLGDVRYELGKTLLALHDAGAVGVLELAARGLEQSNGPDHVRTAEGWLALAQGYLAAGRKSEAAAFAQKAQAIFEARHQPRAAQEAAALALASQD
ncbi:MAG: serine/threonine-protein kinase [Archangium sp.]|nr:serine/threonine-protein kinase [Archangium sp.]